VNSLALLARNLIENGWSGDMNEEYIHGSGHRVVKKITKEKIYLENCVPIGFKQVFNDENGCWS
jgi:hypothetical protein